MPPRNRYSLSSKLWLTLWLVRTRVFYRTARLIRFPFDIRGRKYIDLGVNLTTGVGCRLEAFSEDESITLSFGKNVQINDYVHISAMKNVSVGNNVLMASRIYISDNSHGFYRDECSGSSPEIPPTQRPYYVSEVIIEDNVWIGEGVVVLPGVTIGRGSIVGANSVVSRSLPAEVIAVGQPASAIKKFNPIANRWELLSGDR